MNSIAPAATPSLARVRRLWQAHGPRLLRFALVGGSGALVNMGVLYLLAGRAGWNHLLAAVVASEVSILTNFALNDRWTFRDRTMQTTWLARLVRYNVFAASGVLLTVLILAALTYGLGLHYLIANAIAIGVVTLWNYLVNTRWTWTPSSVDARRMTYGDAQ